jgi:hypothetical protein
MDMDMSIAALSIGLNQNEVQQQLGVSVLKMQMNAAEQGVEAILPQVSGNLDPDIGQCLDVSA